MSITKSVLRTMEPVYFVISGGIKLLSTGAVQVHVPPIVSHVDFFPASFQLYVHGKIIYIDPVCVDENTPADYILITHSHSDHFSIPDIQKLIKPDTTVICTKAAYEKLAKVFKNHDIRLTKPGDRIGLNGMTLETVAAYNLKAGLMAPHLKSAMNAGYIVSSGDIRIYHTGDTDYTPEMTTLENITAALVPIGDGKLTMSTAKAAELINHLKPRFVIPMHYNIGTHELAAFKSLMDNNIQVVIMDGSDNIR